MVIVVLATAALLYSCSKSEKPARVVGSYKLPDKIEHAEPGWAKFITPRALVDSLNRGSSWSVYFLQDMQPEQPEYIVSIPGMISLPMGALAMNSDTIPKKQPIVLICLFGDDSKHMAERLIPYGIHSYYLDGGSYRLYGEMQKYGWKLLPRFSQPQ